MSADGGEGFRLPKEGEFLGVVIKLSGYDKFHVKCSDGNIRLARVPGKWKKKVWIREGDVVIIVPWDFQPLNRGDVVYLYRREEARKLKEMGYLEPLKL